MKCCAARSCFWMFFKNYIFIGNRLWCDWYCYDVMTACVYEKRILAANSLCSLVLCSVRHSQFWGKYLSLLCAHAATQTPCRHMSAKYCPESPHGLQDIEGWCRRPWGCAQHIPNGSQNTSVASAYRRFITNGFKAAQRDVYATRKSGNQPTVLRVRTQMIVL